MATEIDDQLTTYFRWLEAQTGLSLHREDQAMGAQTVPVESVPEITAVELQFRDQPTRQRRQRILVAAVIVGTLVGGAIAATALYRPGGRKINTNTTVVTPTEVTTSTPAIDSTTPATIEPTTTTVTPGPPSTPAAGASGRPGALLGGNVESTTPLYFVSDDPAWRLTEVWAGSALQRTDAYPQIILLGEGDIATRAQATISVGVSSQLPPELADSDGVAVRVGDEEGRGRSTTVDERVSAEVEWPAPDGYVAWIVASGLDLATTVSLAERVTFDGLTSSIDPPAGFRTIVPSPARHDLVANFANEVVTMEIRCSNDGETGFALSRQVTSARTIGGSVVAWRSGPVGLGRAASYDGTTWLVGGWWCTLWSQLQDGGLPPAIPEAKVEALLASLSIVDESTLRASAPDAAISVTPWPSDEAKGDTIPFPAGGAFLAFTGGGTELVTYAGDYLSSEIYFVDPATGEPRRSFPGELVSDDGRLFFDGRSVRDAASGRQVASIPNVASEPVMGDFSPSGELLAVATSRTQATVYESRTGKVVAVSPPLDPRWKTSDTILLSPTFVDEDHVFITGATTTAVMWNLRSGTTRVVATTVNAYEHATLSPDGRWAVASGSGLIDVATGETVLILDPNTQSPSAWSADGSLFAVPAADGSENREIWSTDTLARVFSMPATVIDQGGFSPDATRVVAIYHGTGEVRDTSTGEVVGRLELDDGYFLGAIYSPDGSKIVTADSDGTIRIWPAP